METLKQVLTFDWPFATKGRTKQQTTEQSVEPERKGQATQIEICIHTSPWHLVMSVEILATGNRALDQDMMKGAYGTQKNHLLG